MKSVFRKIRVFVIEYVLILALGLALFFIGSVLGIALSGNRLDGMLYGAYFGLLFSVAFYYYLRGIFFWGIRILQMLINMLITGLIYFLYLNYLDGDWHYDYPELFLIADFSFPAIFLLIKRLLDRVFLRFNEKESKPFLNLK